MPTIDFPTSPTVGQSYSFGNKTWTWNGTGWAVASANNSLSPTVVLPIACSDESTALTVGNGKVTVRMPFGFNLSAVRASVTTAPTGAVLTADIKKNGVSVLSTKLTIDATEKTSTTAAIPAVISNNSFADDDEVTIDVTTIGSTVAGAGLKVYLIGVATANLQREVLKANRTYYVSTTGSDSNNGLSVGSPFLTIQRAVDVVCALDMSTYQVTIQLADGTYADNAVLKAYLGASPPIIKGNTATPSNVHINRAASTGCVLLSSPSTWFVYDMKLSNSSGAAMQTSNKAGLLFFGNIVFGTCSTYHIYADRGSIQAVGNYFISGNAQFHWISLYQGLIITGSRTITLLASVTFTAFAYVIRQSFLNCEAMTFTLGGFTVTGQRYSLDGNSVLYGASGNVNYLPGSAVGTTVTGAQYL